VLEAKRNAFDVVAQQLSNMKLEVERMENRKIAKDKLELYEIKLAVAEALEGRRIINEKQAIVDAASAELQTANEALEPFEMKERELKKKKTVASKSEEEVNTKLSKNELSIKRMKEKVEESENAIIEARNEIRLVDEVRMRDETKLRQCERTLETAEDLLATIIDKIPELNERVEESKVRLKELTSQGNVLDDDLRDIEGDLTSLSNEMKTKTRKMNELQNAKQIFRQKLNHLMSSGKCDARRIKDCITLMDYFDREKESLLKSGHLKGEIYGPVGFYITVACPLATAIIEKCVPQRRQLSFLSTCDEDNRVIRDMIKRLNLDLDSFTMKNIDIPHPVLPHSLLNSFKVVFVSFFLFFIFSIFFFFLFFLFLVFLPLRHLFLPLSPPSFPPSTATCYCISVILSIAVAHFLRQCLSPFPSPPPQPILSGHWDEGLPDR
jgi:chromosome segregation ATPase